MTEGNGSQSGQLWTMYHYQLLVAALSAGLDDDEIAESTGRTPGALKSRARYLLPAPPDDEPKNTRTRWLQLRELFRDDPAYDWVTRVEETHAEKGMPFWNHATDALLRGAWEQQHPGTSALAEQLSLQEHQIAQKLMQLGVASNSIEVVDRLGSTPCSVLDINSRLARDKQSAMVWVLTLADTSGEVFHVSLHPNLEAAAHTRDEPSRSNTRDRDREEQCYWTIAERVVGEGSVRDRTHGTLPPHTETQESGT